MAERGLNLLASGLSGLFVVLLCLATVGLGWLILKFGVESGGVGLLVAWAALAGLVTWLILQRRYFLAAALIILVRGGVYFLTDGAIPASPDAQFYDSLARSLARGHELAYEIDGVTFLAHAPRLYAYLLTPVFFLTGGSPAAPLILNGILDLLTAGILWLAARQFGGGSRHAALVAAAYLLWPLVVLNSVFAQKESLGCLLVASCCFVTLQAWHDRKPRGVAFGIALGLLGMTQPAFFLMAAGFQLVLFCRLPPKVVIRTILVSTVTAVLVLTPWIVRNWIMLGGFVPLTTGAGMNMYVNAAGTYDFPNQLNLLPEPAWSRQMMAAAVEVIAANPMMYAVHQIKMMALGFALEHTPYAVWATMAPPPIVRPEDSLLVTQIPLTFLWGLAAFLSFKRRADGFFLLIFAIVFAYTATISIWFEFGARHRAYMLPLILLWAASTRRTVRESGAEAATRQALPSTSSA